MELRIHLSTILVIFSSLALTLAQDRSISIFAWPQADSSPQTFAQIDYNSTTATINKYTAPRVSDPDAIVRIGFYHRSGHDWSGIVTIASNLVPEKDKKLLLHLNADNEVYHVGFRASNTGSSSKHSTNEMDGLSVELIKIQPGPLVHLNKPVVVNAEGNLDEQPEKTFLQKYWWAIGLFMLLQVLVSGGGGGGG